VSAHVPAAVTAEDRSRAAATARVGDVFDAFARVGAEQLTSLAFPAGDADGLGAARAEARSAAAAAGRLELLDRAATEAVEVALRRFGAMTFDPTWVGLNWGRSAGRAADRAAIAAAVGDAAAAAVVEDLVARDVSALLRERYELVVAGIGSPEPVGSLGRGLALSGTSSWLISGVIAIILLAALVTGVGPLAGAIGLTVIGLTVLGQRLVATRRRSRS
jgi:hypothetical protein